MLLTRSFGEKGGGGDTFLAKGFSYIIKLLALSITVFPPGGQTDPSGLIINYAQGFISNLIVLPLRAIKFVLQHHNGN
jgi:hypothetical protein